MKRLVIAFICLTAVLFSCEEEMLLAYHDYEPGVTHIGDTLLVIGTSGPDEIKIRDQQDDLWVRCKFDIGGPNAFDLDEYYDTTAVNVIVCFTRHGDDVVKYTFLNSVSYTDLGCGNDFFNGGKTTDIVHGNEGHDQILGNQGDDYLYGGTGVDNIQGGLGNDVIEQDGGIVTDCDAAISRITIDWEDLVELDSIIIIGP